LLIGKSRWPGAKVAHKRMGDRRGELRTTRGTKQTSLWEKSERLAKGGERLQRHLLSVGKNALGSWVSRERGESVA